MPKDIQFPEVEPRYVFERDCLGFRAIANGRNLECLVSSELLFSRFRAKDFSEDEMLRIFHEHRVEIHAIARSLIEHGWIDEENRVILTTRYTRLTVRFEEALARDERVQEAHRLLVEIIGPRAGEILVEWHTSPETPPNPSVLLRLRDPSLRREIATAFPRKVMENNATLRIHLATTWNAMLMARSQELILQSG